jgi:hypothetical protein
MGSATAHPGERMENAVKRADLAMLDAKRLHYVEQQHDRRRQVQGAPPIAVAS